MKNTHRAIAAAAMILLILAILITSFQAAVYADSKYRFHEKKYEKYNVTEALDMELEDVMLVTSYMMAYLIGEEKELSIVTTVDGETQDFFNDQDRAHMADVKNLFIGGLRIRNICLVVVLLLFLLLIKLKVDMKRMLPGAYLAGLVIFLTLAGVTGALFASDFTKYFTIFHEIFFTNDLWIFDPETDYMIRMLPESFFADMLARIGLFFAGALALTGGLFYGIKKWNHKND